MPQERKARHFNDSAWQSVNVPHTWNVEDPWGEVRANRKKRVFDVSVNSNLVITGLDLAASPGAFRPLVKNCIDATTTGGIEVKLSAKVGKPVLNGIRVTRRS